MITSEEVQSLMQGEKFGSGFVSGFMGSMGGSASLKYLGGGLGATAVSGFVLGGMGSALAGGNFWVGAITGAGVSVFNHWAHKTSIKSQIKDRLVEKYGKEYLKKPISESTLQELANAFPELYDNSSKQQEFATKDNMVGNLNIEGNKLYNGIIQVNGVVDMYTGKVLFSPHFLGTTNVLSFSGTWYHEMIHSVHVISGFF